MTLDTPRYRLAKYYLGRLRSADTSYRRGQSSSNESLMLLNQDWAQIAQWQAWAATCSVQNQEIARLCAAYPQAGAEVLITRQTPQERIRWLEDGVQAARVVGDMHAEGVCLFRMAWAIHKQALLEAAEHVARKALACAEALNDTLLMGQCLHLLGEILVRHGDFVQAEQLHLRSLTLLQALDAQAAQADVYFSLSENAYYRGEFAQARDYGLQCYHIQTALGLNLSTNNNLNCVGIFSAEAGDLDGGEAYLHQSIELCRSSSSQSTFAHALKSLGGFMIIRHKWELAHSYINESLQIAQSIGEAWLIPDILIFRARLHSRIGEHAMAQRDADQALTIAREIGYQLTLVEALVNMADVLCAAQQIEQAWPALHEGLELAIQSHVPVPILYGIYVAARIWLLTGHAEHAAGFVGLLLQHPGTECAVRSELPALCQQLETQLGSQAFACAIARGRAMSLEEALRVIHC